MNTHKSSHLFTLPEQLIVYVPRKRIGKPATGASASPLAPPVALLVVAPMSFDDVTLEAANVTKDGDLTFETATYTLRAVVCHLPGKVSSHYIAHVRKERAAGLNTEAGPWLCVNDGSVYPALMSEADMKKTATQLFYSQLSLGEVPMEKRPPNWSCGMLDDGRGRSEAPSPAQPLSQDAATPSRHDAETPAMSPAPKPPAKEVSQKASPSAKPSKKASASAKSTAKVPAAKAPGANARNPAVVIDITDSDSDNGGVDGMMPFVKNTQKKKKTKP